MTATLAASSTVVPPSLDVSGDPLTEAAGLAVRDATEASTSARSALTEARTALADAVRTSDIDGAVALVARVRDLELRSRLIGVQVGPAKAALLLAEAAALSDLTADHDRYSREAKANYDAQVAAHGGHSVDAEQAMVVLRDAGARKDNLTRQIFQRRTNASGITDTSQTELDALIATVVGQAST